jgi:hypothetical protein
MRLDGWNHIPRGYGFSWDLSGAPLWLRFWFHLPLLDRFAHPVVVHRGFAWLTPHPDWPANDLDEVPAGWQVRPRTQATAALRWKRRS